MKIGWGQAFSCSGRLELAVGRGGASGSSNIIQKNIGLPCSHFWR